MARKLVSAPAPVVAAPSAAAETAKQLAAELNKPPPKRAVDIPDVQPAHAVLIESIFEGEIDMVRQFKELEAALAFNELNPEAIRAELAKCDTRALLAHRLEIIVKRDRERFKIDADVAIGAMREAALADLEDDKLKGRRTKAITDADVSKRAASKYPDEWREINDKVEIFERYAKHAERLADIWNHRGRTLSAMLGNR